MSLTMYFRAGLLILAFSVSTSALFVAPAHAQPKTGDALDAAAAAQAGALREVDVKMTHPDAEMRMGYLQAFVAEGNARKIERAIRIAMASQDESLRSLGFRAYIASTGSVIFEILLTPQEKQQIEQYQARRIPSLPRYLENSYRAGYSINVLFEPAPLASARGFVKVGGPQLEYAMRGERVTFSGLGIFGGANAQCNWDIRPTRDLKILANLACQNWERPLQLTASMF